MLLGVVGRISFFLLLQRFDADLEEGCRAAGCPRCGGPLHRAHYERKPRGGPSGLPEEVCVRRGLCCGAVSCRRRSLPPSCLFLGRRVYWAGVILVLVTLRQQRLDGRDAARLRRQVGVSRATLARWLSWFRSEFPATPWWQRLRGRVDGAVCNEQLPSALVQHFVAAHGEEEAGLVACLRFLAEGHAP